MASTRSRSVLAAIAVAAVLAYGLAGHGLPQPSSHDGMAGAAAGLCLLLATTLGLVVTSRPSAQSFALPTTFLRTPVAWSVPAPLDGRARASPSTLQRFRN